MSDIYNSRTAKLVKWITRVPDSHCFGVTTGPETTRYSCSEDQVSIRLSGTRTSTSGSIRRMVAG